MKYIIALMLTFLAISVYPRKTKSIYPIPEKTSTSVIKDDTIPKRTGRKIKTKHSIPKKSSNSENVVHTDSASYIEKKNYTLAVYYSQGKPVQWCILNYTNTHIVESDPRKLTVYFNPAAPKYFHVFHDCKKLGAFRKLTESPIEEFLKKNHSAAICPDCNAKSNTFYFIVQFLLDEKQ